MRASTDTRVCVCVRVRVCVRAGVRAHLCTQLWLVVRGVCARVCRRAMTRAVQAVGVLGTVISCQPALPAHTPRKFDLLVRLGYEPHSPATRTVATTDGYARP